MRIKKMILLFCGFLSLSFGAIGLLLPVLPTTPFVIIAAACFASSSPSLHVKLLHSKYFGEFIDNYQNKTGVTRAVKAKGIVFLWAALGISLIIAPNNTVKIILLVVGVCVTIHISMLKGRAQ